LSSIKVKARVERTIIVDAQYYLSDVPHLRNYAEGTNKLGNPCLFYISQIEYSPDSPRVTSENLWTFFFQHGKYQLADAHAKDIRRHRKDYYMVNVYMMDHSGLYLSTNPFGCPWDSGQLGYAYISYDKLRKEYDIAADAPIPTHVTQTAVHQLEQELAMYTMYLNGDVHGLGYIDMKTGENEYIGDYYLGLSNVADQEDMLSFMIDNGIDEKMAESMLKEMIEA